MAVKVMDTLKFWSTDSIVPEFKNLSDTNTKQDLFVDEIISEGYRILMIINACLVCLAHGSNDVANSISPLIVLM